MYLSEIFLFIEVIQMVDAFGVAKLCVSWQVEIA